jgi:hypothetical protein
MNVVVVEFRIAHFEWQILYQYHSTPPKKLAACCCC